MQEVRGEAHESSSEEDESLDCFPLYSLDPRQYPIQEKQMSFEDSVLHFCLRPRASSTETMLRHSNSDSSSLLQRENTAQIGIRHSQRLNILFRSNIHGGKFDVIGIDRAEFEGEDDDATAVLKNN